jgi:DNA-binding transcriptional MerR regulator
LELSLITEIKKKRKISGCTINQVRFYENETINNNSKNKNKK